MKHRRWHLGHPWVVYAKNTRCELSFCVHAWTRDWVFYEAPDTVVTYSKGLGGARTFRMTLIEPAFVGRVGRCMLRSRT